MRHLNFVTTINHRYNPCFVIDPQNLTKVRRAVAENRIELCNLLLEHRNDKRLGKRQINRTIVVGCNKGRNIATHRDFFGAIAHLKFQLFGFRGFIKHRKNLPSVFLFVSFSTH